MNEQEQYTAGCGVIMLIAAVSFGLGILARHFLWF